LDPAPSLFLIHRRTWKVNSANFAITEFSEVFYPCVQG
jgi:hypothetical protein